MGTKRRTARPVRQKPESLRFRSLSAALTVDDIDVSLPWYRDVMGMTVAELWEHEGKVVGAMLKAGETMLGITQDDFKKGRNRVKGVGFRLYCTTAQDIDGLAADIVARGGTLVSGPEDTPWGPRIFAVEDPDGFGLTISTLE